ncbi:MAG: peptide/nickel transport system substrate-binding protein, partial [Chloroflexota bacterium]|nr:peptide/nickel transport system substrate-binding protein [Chloroflexota bacterium]
MIGGVMLLLGCSPASTGGTPNAPVASAPDQPKTQKVLTIALQADREPPSPAMFGSPGGGTGTGSGSSSLEPFYVFHSTLTTYDPSGTAIPVMAQKIPSLQDGDWKLPPEGGMEVTWKLKPGILWHDGTPLTTADLILGYQLNTDPELSSIPGELANITNLKALDDQTLVVTWKTVSIAGGVSGYDGIAAAPKHIFGDMYAAGDKTALQNSPYWSTQFVGLGPYRLTQWSRGSFIEGTAFDQYFGGRPKIDRVVLKFLGDVNAIVANMLSGDVDMIPLGAQLDAQPLSVVRDAWIPTNGGTTGAVAKGVRSLYLQFKDPSAPWAQDLRVRQAMLHALDRDSIVDNLEADLTQRADFFAPIGDPVLNQATSQALPQYKFDLTRVAQLMGEAGWTKGADGTFRNAAGQPFSIAVATSNEG